MRYIKDLLKKNIFKYWFFLFFWIIIDYCIYTILYYKFHLHIIPSNYISFSVWTFVNVILIRNFVFKKYKFSLLKDFWLSLITNGFVFFIWIIILAYFINTFHINHYIWKTIVITFTFFINYFTRKYLFTHKVIW
jgi:putative flippase GtrA